MNRFVVQFLRGASLLVLLGTAAACQKDAGIGQTDEGRLVLGEAEQTETVQRTVALSGRPLVLDGFRGTIRLSGTDADVATLTFTKQARGRDDKDAADVLRRVTLDETGDEQAYRFTMRARQNDLSRVDIEGEVPRGADVRIRLESGEVRLSEIAGPLDVTAESGDVAIAGAGGSVGVELRNGPIDVGMYRLAAGSTVSLRTANGDIVFTVPSSAQAQVEAQTSAGDISVEGLAFAQRRLNPEGAGARFQGRLGRDGASVNLRTENGAIALREGTVLRLPSDLPAPALDADTSRTADSLRSAPPAIPQPAPPDTIRTLP